MFKQILCNNLNYKLLTVRDNNVTAFTNNCIYFTISVLTLHTVSSHSAFLFSFGAHGRYSCVFCNIWFAAAGWEKDAYCEKFDLFERWKTVPFIEAQLFSVFNSEVFSLD